MTGGAVAEGPYFDELERGQVFRSAPGLTLTSGLVDTHRAIVGGRLALALDAALCAEVTGATLAPPNVVWDVAIGQSTVATHHVQANLFYRGLVFHRAPELGDTLRTTTTVVALRQNKGRPGRRPTGLAVLRITTVDQQARPVLDFWRCAMLPLRDPDRVTGHHDDIETVGGSPSPADLEAAVKGWDLERFAATTYGPRFADLSTGQTWTIGGGDLVSCAPELARLSLNIAEVHHDSRTAGGQRLVYGGHTISLALAQASRALPSLVTVAGWDACHHVGPVHEGDTLRSDVSVEGLTAIASGGGLVHLRSRVRADGTDGQPDRDVLDWRFVAVLP